jgi:broad specificity phosphatase PhoE
MDLGSRKEWKPGRGYRARDFLCRDLHLSDIGGETSEVQARHQHAGAIAKHPMESTLLLCSHNFVNLTILCYALQIPLNRFREVRQDTAALNVLYIEGERLVAKVVNDRAPLKDYDRSEAK